MIDDLKKIISKIKETRHSEGKEPSIKQSLDPGKQDLDLYWDPEYSKILETWGEGNVWDEIQFLLVNCKGNILDVACGTGRTIEILSQVRDLTIYGCDISDLLINKAIERGINPQLLSVCDATKMNFSNDFFDYSYSIGSLEHFTEEGVSKCITECNRVTRYNSFHMLPVSRSGKNEGWMKTVQSFNNNSTNWWLEKFNKSFDTVYVLDSKWSDLISVGKWFICKKESTL
jgi:ubiquinone/menaquinone biosynthesis C-methylase UbiE